MKDRLRRVWGWIIGAGGAVAAAACMCFLVGCTKLTAGDASVSGLPLIGGVGDLHIKKTTEDPKTGVKTTLEVVRDPSRAYDSVVDPGVGALLQQLAIYNATHPATPAALPGTLPSLAGK